MSKKGLEYVCNNLPANTFWKDLDVVKAFDAGRAEGRLEVLIALVEETKTDMLKASPGERHLVTIRVSKLCEMIDQLRTEVKA